MNTSPPTNYKVQVYVDFGYFEYEVSNKSTALEHGQQIMSRGVYRYVRPDGNIDMHKCYKVKIVGPDLGTLYPATFHRT